ncbi:MAG: hypothetical protein BMS9Abin15_1047 [Gammaproteobacteria bacterium]|nr:MAG: hypothetical protein BMS9Abin15_1047 [Gammaproteobacteria bacterium]
MKPVLNFWQDVLNETVIALFGVGAVVGVVIGLLMMLAPDKLSMINRVMNRSFSTRRSLRWLETSTNFEHFFYRHHKPFGVAIIVGSGLSLVNTAYAWTKRDVLLGLYEDIHPYLAGPALDITIVALGIGTLFTLAVGVVVLLRPSLLKGLEAHANRWISTRQAFRFMEKEIHVADTTPARAPRVLGLLLLIGSLYVLSNLGIIMA